MEQPQIEDKVSFSCTVADLKEKLIHFKGGCIKSCYNKWCELTSDPEVLNTVSGLSIKLVGDLPSNAVFQYPFGTKEQIFAAEEIKRLLAKEVIVVSKYEIDQFMSPIFVRPKSDGLFRLILNLKKLNEVTQYVHFKMETLTSVLRLVRPGSYMAKIDIKDAYYSVPIKTEDQRLLKFEFDNLL